MKCPHCDYEKTEAFAYCPKCGKPSTREPDPIVICPTPRILSLIKSDLFFIVCILLTVGCGCMLLSAGFNVLTLLITIFSWLTYVGGRKNVVEHTHIKVISGSVYTIYVINNILAIITAICGVIYTLALSIPTILGGFNIEEFISTKLTAEEYGPLALIPFTMVALISALAMVLGFILIALAIVILIFNLAGVKKIHRLIQSIYKSAEAGEENFVGVNKAQPWIIIFAVLSILSAISCVSANDIFGFLSESAFAAALIICNILVSKHLCDK